MAWQFAAGEVLTAANLNAVTKPWNAVCQASMSGAQSITSGSTAALTLDVDILDPLAWHDHVTTPTLVIPSIAGYYEASATGNWGSDTDYTAGNIAIQKNGAALSPLLQSHQMIGNLTTPGFTVGGRLIVMNGSSDSLRLVATQTNTSANANSVNAVFTVRLVYPT